jgi:tRNA uridine 5-carbamoylmethylation protein Kti12
MKTSKFIILQGIPASGKSTWAREFLKTQDKTEWVIVNRDSIRKMRGDYWIPEQEIFISRVVEEIVDIAMQYGYNIISDDTNMNFAILKTWRDNVYHVNFSDFYPNKYEIEYKFFHIDVEEAIRRDSLRETPVGEKVIKGFYDKYKEEYNL